MAMLLVLWLLVILLAAGVSFGVAAVGSLR